MKKLLSCILIFAIGTALSGFTFYEETENKQSQVSLEAFLAGDEDSVSTSNPSVENSSVGVQYDAYRNFSITIPLQLSSADVLNGTDTILAITEDDNILILCMRMDGYGSTDMSYYMDEMAAIFLEAANESDDIFRISGQREISHPIADKAYQHDFYYADGEDSATCKITYLVTKEAFYLFVTGYEENPGADIVAALDNIPMTLTEY